MELRSAIKKIYVTKMFQKSHQKYSLKSS